MGKNLKGKELGKGITQRPDGRYQARYTNRFGQRKTIYNKDLNKLKAELKQELLVDTKEQSVKKEITVNEWFETWLQTYKKHCRDSTIENYRIRYRRVKQELGWRKLNKINTATMQKALNNLCSDNARNETKKILVDMMERAIDSDLITRNYARQLVVRTDEKDGKERRVLTIEETALFLEFSEGSFYRNLFVLALETGMRIGEILGLKKEDIDFKKKIVYINRTLCYFRNEGKYIHEIHQTKTASGKRAIPLSSAAVDALKKQLEQVARIDAKEIEIEKEFQDLIFKTKNKRPTQQFIVQECMNLIIKKIQQVHECFEPFTPHAFRHTFATRALEAGVQPKTLSALLGHSTLQLTMDLYCHVMDDTLQDAIKTIETAKSRGCQSEIGVKMV